MKWNEIRCQRTLGVTYIAADDVAQMLSDMAGTMSERGDERTAKQFQVVADALRAASQAPVPPSAAPTN